MFIDESPGSDFLAVKEEFGKYLEAVKAWAKTAESNNAAAVAAAAQRRSLALAQSSAGQYGGPAGLAKLHVMAAIAIASGRHAFSIFGASAMARFLGALHYRHNAVGGLFVPRSDNWYRTKGMEEVQALYQVKLKTVVINHSQAGRALQVSADGWTGPRGLPVTDFVLRTNDGPLLLAVADGSEQLRRTGKVKDATYLAQLLREQIRGINAMHPHGFSGRAGSGAAPRPRPALRPGPG